MDQIERLESLVARLQQQIRAEKAEKRCLEIQVAKSRQDARVASYAINTLRRHLSEDGRNAAESELKRVFGDG